MIPLALEVGKGTLISSALRCRALGHKWRWQPLKHSGAWSCDEACVRCGAETWWIQ